MPDAEPTVSEANYAKWMLNDPQGITLETFHSLNAVPMFGTDEVIQLKPVSTCCKPPNI